MQSKTPLVSIITVVWNGEKFIERTIKSVINQTYSAIEYIIIDGGSQDKTLDIIKKYEKNISCWISEPDKGIFDAMNKGLRRAKGKYVWIISGAGDEIYDPTTLSKIFKLNNDGDVYYGDLMYVNNEGKEVGFPRARPPENLSWKGMGTANVAWIESLIIKKSLVDEFKLSFPVSSDVDWIINALKKSNKMVNTRLILSKFLIGGNSTKKRLESYMERYLILNEHFGTINNLINHLYMVAHFLIYHPSRLLTRVGLLKCPIRK